jgi:phosphatidylglycerol---prolipoprotein diacylglyceryl transferase
VITPAVWHTIFETASYFVGAQVFWWLRRRSGDVVEGQHRWLIIGGMIFAAAIGSRLLAGLESPIQFHLQGKSVVGGLIGGLVGVELTKKLLGIRQSTGDLLAIPLCIGICVGRIGCFIAGLPDQTHGVATNLPWAVDFGDGVPRHPTQLYEILFCLSLAAILWQKWWGKLVSPMRAGDLFKLFMIGYMTWRLLIDGLKPGYRYGISTALQFTAIQWACLATLIYYGRDIIRLIQSRNFDEQPS